MLTSHFAGELTGEKLFCNLEEERSKDDYCSELLLYVPNAKRFRERFQYMLPAPYFQSNVKYFCASCVFLKILQFKKIFANY